MSSKHNYNACSIPALIAEGKGVVERKWRQCETYALIKIDVYSPRLTTPRKQKCIHIHSEGVRSAAIGKYTSALKFGGQVSF
jgi:hypothetical protein